MWELRKILFGLGGLQVISTIAFVTLTAHMMSLTWPVAIVVGMGVAMSSTAIGLTSLTEKNCSIPLGPGFIRNTTFSGFIGHTAIHAFSADCTKQC